VSASARSALAVRSARGWFIKAAFHVLVCAGLVQGTAQGQALDEPGGSSGVPDDEQVTGSDPADGAGEQDATDVSSWYLERGVSRRPADARDDVPEVFFKLASLLRDGAVPGFYDGQFASTVGDFDELVRVAQDRSMHHTIRIMAVMALQEAADGQVLADALTPLLIPPDLEVITEYSRARRDYFSRTSKTPDDATIRAELDVDLSRYTRFALAKDGQPEAIRERIRELEQWVLPKRAELLDRGYSTMSSYFRIYFGRSLWFDIAYHYQQFDDYETAAHWFRQLTQNLSANDTKMAHYNLACIAALQGRPKEAVQELELAVSGGFRDVEWMDEDADLESLRERSDYQDLRLRLRNGGVGPGLMPTFAPGDPESGVSPPETDR
jgi:hypothetical protein